MMKILFRWVLAAFLAVIAAGCTPSGEQQPEEVDPSTLEKFKLDVPVTQDWIFGPVPEIVVNIQNSNPVAVDALVEMRLNKDTKQLIERVQKEVKVPANKTIDVVLSPSEPLSPGFYKASCYVNKKSARAFNFGVNPFEIVSAPDKQPDFDQFWATAFAQLPDLNVSKPVLTEVTKKSSSTCKVYLVEFQSVPDGLEGEPVTVRGYYLEPQDGKKHPVIMHFYGYDALENPGTVSCPSGGSGTYAEFYLSHRGQYINRAPASKREDGIDRDFSNIYGDWFAFNFGNKNGYYYRGAFMDCVQAVHFMATRPTSDMSNLFAEGSSQGGALSYAAAALSDIPFTAIAPNVAFLGDFPDYFRIVDWPASVAKANKGSMTDDEMYAFLSYFDTKNLATRINCAVWATSGLQDATCPSHTNMAPFNNLPSKDKHMSFYPLMQHSYPSTWTSDIMKFFKDRIK